MVAEHDEKVVGFMIYELHKTRLHILNFAVAPQYRRLGIGRQMVTKLIGKLSSHRRTRDHAGGPREPTSSRNCLPLDDLPGP